jgi:hypothetical protein
MFYRLKQYSANKEKALTHKKPSHAGIPPFQSHLVCILVGKLVETYFTHHSHSTYKYVLNAQFQHLPTISTKLTPFMDK